MNEIYHTWAGGYFGKDFAKAAGGYIAIGFLRRTYADWLENYRGLLEFMGYSPAEVERYGAWIRLTVEWLTDAEKDYDDHTRFERAEITKTEVELWLDEKIT